MSNNDLTEEQQHEIWLIACSRGVDIGRATAIWKEQQLNKKYMEEKQPEPQTEEEDEEEEVEETVEPSELEQLRLSNQKRIQKLIDNYYEELEEAESQQEKTDDLVRLIENNSEIETLVRGYVGLMLSFSRYEDVGRVQITMTREGDKIQFGFKMFNKDGSETYFDKDGDIIKIRSSTTP